MNPTNIPVEQVASVVWSVEQGEKLVKLRDKLSRQKLSLRMHDLGFECTPQNMQKIEQGTAKSVPIATLHGIVQALEISLEELIPGMGKPSKFPGK